MNISNILSPRNVTLFVFILVVLFLGATFDVKVGHESFANANANANANADLEKELMNLKKEKESMKPNASNKPSTGPQ